MTREREPKPALSAVAAAYSRLPFPPDLPWPSITLAVCTHNNAATLGDTCEALSKVRPVLAFAACRPHHLIALQSHPHCCTKQNVH